MHLLLGNVITVFKTVSCHLYFCYNIELSFCTPSQTTFLKFQPPTDFVTNSLLPLTQRSVVLNVKMIYGMFGEHYTVTGGNFWNFEFAQLYSISKSNLQHMPKFLNYCRQPHHLNETYKAFLSPHMYCFSARGIWRLRSWVTRGIWTNSVFTTKQFKESHKDPNSYRPTLTSTLSCGEWTNTDTYQNRSSISLPCRHRHTSTRPHH